MQKRYKIVTQPYCHTVKSGIPVPTLASLVNINMTPDAHSRPMITSDSSQDLSVIIASTQFTDNTQPIYKTYSMLERLFSEQKRQKVNRVILLQMKY